MASKVRTIRVPLDIHERMLQHKDVNWSAVCIRAIKSVLDKSENSEVDDLFDALRMAQRNKLNGEKNEG